MLTPNGLRPHRLVLKKNFPKEPRSIMELEWLVKILNQM